MSYRITPVQCQGARSLVYDLCTGQGVVSSRAASILRSVETQPLIGWFVLPSLKPKFGHFAIREICQSKTKVWPLRNSRILSKSETKSWPLRNSRISRAASILRSVETEPLIGWFVLPCPKPKLSHFAFKAWLLRTQSLATSHSKLGHFVNRENPVIFRCFAYVVYVLE